MKKILVKATRGFNDAVELVYRKQDDEFIVSKERYEELKAHNAVEMIAEEVEEVVEEIVEDKPKKTNKKKSK